MQWVITFLLLWSFLETRALPSQSQFYHILQLLIRGALATNLNNSLHIATLGTYQPTSNLKFLIIVYLNIKSACVFYILILHLLGSCLALLVHSRLRHGFIKWLAWDERWWTIVLLLLLRTSYLLPCSRIWVNILIGKLCHLRATCLIHISHLWNSCLLLLLITISTSIWVKYSLIRLLLDRNVFLVGLNISSEWFLSEPFYWQLCIIFAQIKVIQRLLSEKRSHDVMESNQCIPQTRLDSNLLDLAEDLEYLKRVGLTYYEMGIKYEKCNFKVVDK